MPTPQPGDILIRRARAGGCELVDAVTHKHIDGPFEAALTAIVGARLRGAHAIWQQHLDDRGRPLGDPFRLP